MLSFAIIMILQAATIVRAPVPAPPPTVSIPAPRASIAPLNSAARYTIDVEVRAGSDILWSGPMTVSTTRGASFNRELSEPSPLSCNEGGYDQQIRNTLSIQLDAQRTNNSDDTFGVTVRWGRSLPGVCAFRNSNRTVELSESLKLEPGRAVTVVGDGGLAIRLRRR